MFPVDLIAPQQIQLPVSKEPWEGVFGKNKQSNETAHKQSKGEISIGLDKTAVFYKIGLIPDIHTNRQ